MSQTQIPEQMTAVVLDSYTGVEGIRVEQRPVPKPGKNEVLVKIAASPINPSDLAFLIGRYGFKKPTPVVPGFEGSGMVVAVGEGFMGRYLLGKRVACRSQDKGDGVWADYMVTPAKDAQPLDQAVSLEQGAMSGANPLTATAFVEIAKKGGHKAIVLTAAAGALASADAATLSSSFSSASNRATFSGSLRIASTARLNFGKPPRGPRTATSASTSSRKLCGKILVDMPTAMPSVPSMSSAGTLAGRKTGSFFRPS